MRFESLLSALFVAGAVAEAVTEISDRQLQAATDASSASHFTGSKWPISAASAASRANTQGNSAVAVISVIGDGQIQAPVTPSVIPAPAPPASTHVVSVTVVSAPASPAPPASTAPAPAPPSPVPPAPVVSVGRPANSSVAAPAQFTGEAGTTEKMSKLLALVFAGIAAFVLL
jgi:hypothetical protein